MFRWPEQREQLTAIMDRVTLLFETCDSRIVVGATFPLERAADAHRALKAGEVVGKAGFRS